MLADMPGLIEGAQRGRRARRPLPRPCRALRRAAAPGRRHRGRCRRRLAHDPRRTGRIRPRPCRQAGDDRAQQDRRDRPGARRRREVPALRVASGQRCWLLSGRDRRRRAARCCGRCRAAMQRVGDDARMPAANPAPASGRGSRQRGGPERSAHAHDPRLRSAAARRLVVKIGCACWWTRTGEIRRAGSTAWPPMSPRCRARGQEVIVVSSGAIALGAPRISGCAAAGCGWRKSRPPPPPGRSGWRTPTGGAAAARHHRRADPADPGRHRGAAPPSQRARHLAQLLALGAVPVVNENDTIATAEIRFGDNDRLAARVAQMIQRRHAGAAVRHRRALHRRPAPRPARRAYPGGAGDRARDRGDGRRGAAGLQLGRHGHQAGRRAHRDAGRLRDADRARAHVPSARSRAIEAGRARTLFLPRAEARSARKAWIAGAVTRPGRWSSTTARRGRSRRQALLPAGVVARRGRVSSAAIRVIMRGPAARRWRAACRPMPAPTPAHRRPQERMKSRRSSATVAATRSSTATIWW